MLFGGEFEGGVCRIHAEKSVGYLFVNSMGNLLQFGQTFEGSFEAKNLYFNQIIWEPKQKTPIFNFQPQASLKITKSWIPNHPNINTFNSTGLLIRIDGKYSHNYSDFPAKRKKTNSQIASDYDHIN
jgi:hypothetical protein